MRQISHYFGGQIAVMAAGFISMPILTRALGPERYGVVSLVLTMLVLMSALAKFGLSHATVRFAGRPEPGKEREERALQTSLIVASLIATFGAVALVNGAAWYYIHYPSQGTPLGNALKFILDTPVTARLMMLASLILIPRTLTLIVSALQRAEQQSGAWTAFAIFLRYGSLVVSIGALLYWHSLTAYIGGILFAECTVVAWFTIGWWRSHKLGFRLFSPSLMRMCLVYGLPMIGFELGSVVVAYCDKYIVLHFWGQAAVGLYTAGYGIAEILPAVLAFPIELAVTPHCFRLWEKEGEERTADFVSRSAARYAVAAFPVLALFCVAAPAIVNIMAGSEYANSVSVVPWVLAGLALWCGFYPLVGMGFLVRKKTLAFTGIMMIAVVLNAALNWVMVPHMGILGSAVATFITYALMLVMTGVGSARYLRVKWQWASFARAVTFSVGIAALVSLPPIGWGLAASLARVLAGAVLYSRIVTPLDANAQWVVGSGSKWLREHSLPAGWLRLLTGYAG